MADKILPKTKYDLPWAKHAPNAIIQSGVLRVTCGGCGERFSKTLTPQEESKVITMYENNGELPFSLVRNEFPNWSDDNRELFLQSHLCPVCYKEYTSSGEAGEE